MDAQEVIERLCKLQAEVWEAVCNPAESADCFCGKGGFWHCEGYDGTFDGGYRNSGKALEFIERAVREKIAARQTLGDQGK